MTDISLGIRRLRFIQRLRAGPKMLQAEASVWADGGASPDWVWLDVPLYEEWREHEQGEPFFDEATVGLKLTLNHEAG